MKSIILILFLLAVFTFGSKIVLQQDLSSCDQNLSPKGRQKKCGDGRISKFEECDDGNTKNGDGCFKCKIIKGWTCTGTKHQKSVCTKTCGNGKLDIGEQCDYAMPGRVCTLDCVKDLNKIQTCFNSSEQFNLSSGQVCDGPFGIGCYNCLVISTNAVCTATVDEQTGLNPGNCKLKCSKGAADESYDVDRIISTFFQILAFGSQRINELNVTIVDSDMFKDLEELASLNNANMTFIKQIFTGQTDNQIDQQHLFYALFYYLDQNLSTDANGVKILTWKYPNVATYISSAFKYGVDDVNSLQDCVKLVAIPVDLP